jgi:hypothetical protein
MASTRRPVQDRRRASLKIQTSDDARRARKIHEPHHSQSPVRKTSRFRTSVCRAAIGTSDRPSEGQETFLNCRAIVLIPVDAAKARTRPYHRSMPPDFDHAAVPRDRRHTNPPRGRGPGTGLKRDYRSGEMVWFGATPYRGMTSANFRRSLENLGQTRILP